MSQGQKKIESRLDESKRTVIPRIEDFPFKSYQNTSILAVLKREEIYQEMKSKIEAFERRMRDIENRLTLDATVHRTSTVSDTVLVTNFESFAKSVEKIEEKMLSKWDVVVIVFEIITVLAVLGTLGLAILHIIM